MRDLGKREVRSIVAVTDGPSYYIVYVHLQCILLCFLGVHIRGEGNKSEECVLAARAITLCCN